jgi:glucosylceramidase
MTQQTRREFLELATMGLAATTVPAAVAEPRITDTNPQERSSPVHPEIAVRVTSPEERFAAAPSITWAPSSKLPTPDCITLLPSVRFQEILGFGGAFTDATCYMFNQLAAPERETLFHEMFHSSEMGLSIGRVCVGSSDYSTKLYSYDDGDPDPDLSRFAIDHDREYIIPILQQARHVNPDLFLFSSPWSPPGWMKFNNSMLGGSMRKHYFDVYARYYLKFLNAYAAESVPIQALTSQNEVDTDQDGRMPACLWGQEYEIEFVRDHLGPLLEKNGVPTKIWVLDHNYNLWGRVLCTLEDEKLRRYVSAVAWHGYNGTAQMMSKVQQAHPEIEMHWTEGGPDYTDPNYLTDWCKWGSMFTEVLRNWCCSITTWNLALDEKGRPNIGPFSCGGGVTIHSQTKEITRSGQFLALAHFSRAIKRGARRFQSQSVASGLDYVAFENPDGQQALVLTNPGAARSIELRLANLTTTVSLKEKSITTLSWH